MTVLIVVESSFGNTVVVATAIASGLVQTLDATAVTVIRPGQAPRELSSEVRLLLVGVPTHEFSMPKEQSRRQAVAKGAANADTVGIREWIGQVTHGRTRPELLRHRHGRAPGLRRGTARRGLGRPAGRLAPRVVARADHGAVAWRTAV